MEERREHLAVRGRMAREREEEATRQRFALLSSMSRSFAGAMRTTMAERKRYIEERERLLSLERAARAEAETARERMHEILESIGDAFFALDEEERFTYVNRKAEQLWGKRRGELLGRNIWKVFSQAVDSELYRSFEKAKKEGTAVEFETVSSITGTWLSGHIYPSPGGFSVYFVDIEERKRAERERELLNAEVMAEKERSNTILESITQSFIAFDHNWRYTYINRTARELHHAWGRDPETLLNKVMWEEYPELAETGFQRELLRAAREREVVEFEEFYPSLDTWFSVRAYPSSDGVSVYMEDITERRSNEKAVRCSEERYRSLVTATALIVCNFASSGGISEECPPWEDFTGQAFEEYREFGWLRAVHPEDRRSVTENWERAVRKKTPFEEVYRLLRRDARYRYVAARTVPILEEGGGEVREWIGTITDIHGRKVAEEALKESEERLRAVATNAPVILFALDREGVFTFSTGRGLKVLGLESEEVIGRSVYELYAETPRILEDVQCALAGEQFTVEREVEGLTFETSYSAVPDPDGYVVGVIGVSTDVTERKSFEKERDQLLARRWTIRAEAEERGRISRELHDRVAHSMAVVHQSLELYDVLKESSPSQAGVKMDLAREMAREALDSTRNLSRELRSPEVEDGLSSALSNLLETTVPPGLAWPAASPSRATSPWSPPPSASNCS